MERRSEINSDEILIIFSFVGMIVFIYLLFQSNRLFRTKSQSGELLTIGHLDQGHRDVRRRFQNDFVFQPFQAHEELYYGDTLYTGQKSSAIVSFKNGSQLEVGSESLVVFDESQRTLALRIEFGHVNGKLVASERHPVKIQLYDKVLELTSPEAIFRLDRHSGQSTQLKVQKGEVTVRNTGTQKSVKVAMNESLRFKGVKALPPQFPNKSNATQPPPIEPEEVMKVEKLSAKHFNFADNFQKNLERAANNSSSSSQPGGRKLAQQQSEGLPATTLNLGQPAQANLTPFEPTETESNPEEVQTPETDESTAIGHFIDLRSWGRGQNFALTPKRHNLKFNWKYEGEVAEFVLTASKQESMTNPLFVQKTKTRDFTWVPNVKGSMFWQVVALDEKGKTIDKSEVVEWNLEYFQSPTWNISNNYVTITLPAEDFENQLAKWIPDLGWICANRSHVFRIEWSMDPNFQNSQVYESQEKRFKPFEIKNGRNYLRVRSETLGYPASDWSDSLIIDVKKLEKAPLKPIEQPVEQPVEKPIGNPSEKPGPKPVPLPSGLPAALPNAAPIPAPATIPMPTPTQIANPAGLDPNAKLNVIKATGVNDPKTSPTPSPMPTVAPLPNLKSPTWITSPTPMTLNEDNIGKTSIVWSPQEKVTKYVVETSRNIDFDSIVQHKETNRTTMDLKEESWGKFFIRIAAVREDGKLGPWSDPKIWTLDLGTPTVQKVQDIEVNLPSWDSPIPAKKIPISLVGNSTVKNWILEEYEDESLTKKKSQRVVDGRTTELNLSNPENTFFRLHAIDKSGNPVGKYSDIKKVSYVVKRPLMIPQLTNPKAGITIILIQLKEPKVRLDWKVDPWSTEHLIEFSKDINFQTVLKKVQSKNSNLWIDPREFRGKIYWRVKSTNQVKGLQSEFSEPRTFIVVEIPREE